MTTTEKNKLIDDFMGNMPVGDLTYYYHNDWNALMPVVEKILTDKSSIILLPMGGIKDSVSPYIDARRPVLNALMKVDMDCIYIAVFDFIQWHNQSKQQLNNDHFVDLNKMVK